MARLELRIVIKATPEEVWPLLSDFEDQTRWMVDLRKLEVTSAMKQGIGTRLKVTSELFGLPIVKDDMVVDYWQEPRIYSVIHRGQFSGSGYFELTPVAGGTELTWVEEFRPPLGPFGELGFRLVVGPHLRRVFMRSMFKVKGLAEAVADSEREQAGDA